MIVWLASYPRSGNTFFRVILNSIFHIKTYSIYDDKGDIGADEKTSDAVGHEFLPKDFDIQQARDEEKIYYIKTHELLDNRVDVKDKIIYLIRDGRESTLSFTKHQNTFAHQNKKLIDTIYGHTFIGSWGEHVQSWNPKNRDNTLLVKFEELIKDPGRYIEILSNFLEVKPIGNKIPTFEELKKINPKFFRSGKTNSWENIYSEEEHVAFWLKNNQVMLDYGYDKPLKMIDEIKDIQYLKEISNQNLYSIKLTLEEVQQKNKILQKQTKIIQEQNKTIQEHNKTIQEQNKTIQEQNKTIQELSQKNKDLANSKKYKLALFLTYPYVLLKKILGR